MMARNPYEYNAANYGNYVPSSSYGVPQAFGTSDSQGMMMNMASMYGQQFATQGKEKLEKFVSVATLKYYFLVNNAYVGKKLGILLFPFAHTNWQLQYNSESEPVPPRLDVNASDLYIPVMAFVTYVFVAGFVLGTQDRFSPEQLGVISSAALAWLIFENLIIILTKYIMGISSALRFYDTLAYSGYKYVGMIVCLVTHLLFGKLAYYGAVAYCSIAVAFFLIRSVKVEILSAGEAEGRKRKLYLLIYISLTQPFIIYWLTSSLL